MSLREYVLENSTPLPVIFSKMYIFLISVCKIAFVHGYTVYCTYCSFVLCFGLRVHHFASLCCVCLAFLSVWSDQYMCKVIKKHIPALLY